MGRGSGSKGESDRTESQATDASGSSTITDAEVLALEAAGVIAQTNADGLPTQRAPDSQAMDVSDEAAARKIRKEQARLQKMKDLQKNDTCGGFWFGISTSLLNLCCCIYAEDDLAKDAKNKVLLPPQISGVQGRKCLVLDLDETLVHSSFKPVDNPDIVIPVEIDGTIHQVYVIKRPGVDKFLARAGELFEVVVFTASLAKYADPLLDELDPNNVIKHRLFRESCTLYLGNYVKDLAILGRPIESVIIVDNSPASYLFQPENAIGVSSFIDDKEDRELVYCLRFLESIKDVQNVSTSLHEYPAFVSKLIADVPTLEGK
mmetsp:Transcript_11127/g.19585  ORF Transcript_11127/g.19585 Transcript_11127/m.19585 type:complete len:319 (+) Transcript_11127:721-1677(+)|eukprot:CAMPEP_0184519300 /NCGR_PEP_ID=MMETSP0198_2-20121128/6555_1 /TAXON_ID=1112570 /ORGANISM="Thraustochytrium sp., Strain LLF1b" /LENGTH=318 /DNA_ID=CAMNT_0026909811 /DNA_START=723 /DNA_END=1679 /DNA_ORIENTATION=+